MRRFVLLHAGIALALASSPFPVRAQAGGAVMAISVETLAGRVRVLRGYANGNILALPTTAGTLLVDGQSTKRVAEADSVLRAAGMGDVRWVVTTHYHGDHLEGNAHWRAIGAQVFAHANVRAQAAKDTTIVELGWHRTTADAASLPTTQVGDSTRLVLGRDTVYLLHAPRAHTDGDLVVWMPRRNLLHAGDIVELGAFPFLDWWSGGTLDGMIAAVDRILAMANDETIIIPGHGPSATRRRVAEYRAMLTTVRERVGASVRAGKTVDEVLAAAPLADFAATNGGEGAARRFAWLVYYDLSHSQKRANR